MMIFGENKRIINIKDILEGGSPVKFDYTLFNLHESQCFTTENYQYWIFLTGSGTISEPDQSFSFQPHDLAEIPIGASIEILCDSPVSVGCITLSDFFITNTHLRYIPSQNTELIRKVFFLAIDFAGISSPFKASMMASIDQLLWEVITSSNLIANTIPPAVEKVLLDIVAHCSDCTYDVSEAISQTGYSKSHFRKLFRDTTGCSPVDFINTKRIECAKKLMREKHETMAIKDIAQASGFSDTYYFSRLFKKREHITPSEYISQIEK